MSISCSPYESVPWELVAEFCTLNELLLLRLVSRLLASCVSNVSPDCCAELLQKNLRSELTLVSESWQKPLTNFTAELLTGGEAFDTMIRILRVANCLPTEMAIAYSGEFGRHAIPLQWNNENRTLEVSQFPQCRRRKCPTCRIRIPHEDYPDAEVYNCINIRYKKHRFNLTKHFPKCIPNLPHDLRCPHCLNNRERTLVLGILSYHSSSVDNKTLSFTPRNENAYAEEEDESSDAQGEESKSDAADITEEPDTNIDITRPDRKRKRSGHVQEDSFAFPPVYDDVAVPHIERPVRPKETAKFGISIHCTACEHFGIVAPATPCFHPDFSCHHKMECLQFASQQSTVGAVWVRNKCSHDQCGHATMCRTCCRRSKHRPYASDARQEPVTSKCWCKYCHPNFDSGIYCNSCAWVTTVCHHL